MIEHPPLSEKIYQIIKVAILKGRFSPDERLNFDQLSIDYGVSRTPLREALVRLEKEGFVQSVPRKGTFIKKLTIKEIIEIYEIRERLEGYAAHLAALSASRKQIEAMERCCDYFEEGVKQQNMETCIENDFLFHELLIEESKNKKLAEIIKTFYIQTHSILQRGPNYLEFVPTYLEEHRSIINAIKEKDTDLAERLVADHIRKGKELLITTVHGENFISK